MKTTTKNTGIKVTTSIKVTTGIKVITGIKAGGFDPKFNHSIRGLAVKTALKAGFKCMQNHSGRMLAVA
jgi:hypothetical protein